MATAVKVSSSKKINFDCLREHAILDDFGDFDEFQNRELNNAWNENEMKNSPVDHDTVVN